MGQSSPSKPKESVQVVQEDPASLEDTIPTGFISSLQQEQHDEHKGEEHRQWENDLDVDHGEVNEHDQNNEGRSNEEGDPRVADSILKDDENGELTESLTPLGMNLDYMKDFYDVCGGRVALEGLTVFDVFSRFILNFVRHSSQRSFNGHLRTQRHPSVGPASIFVSVSWKYDFVDVMDTLQSFLGDKDQWGGDCYVWFDFYSDYYTKFQVAEEVGYDQWEDLFCRARDLFGTIYIIHIPWNHSFVQERDFFVETLESTVDMVNINKVVRFGVELIKNYIDFMDETARTDVEIVENVNVRFRLIHDMGRLYTFGGEQTNADMLYKKTLYDMRANEHVGGNHCDTVAIMNDFALLMCDADVYGTNKLEEAEKLFNDCINVLEKLAEDSEKNMKIMRPDESNVIIIKNNLAYLYELQGRFEDAYNLHTYCMEAFANILGPSHSLSILSKNNLATVYLKTAVSLEALESLEHIYEDCIQVCYKMEGPTKKDKLWSIVYMTNLASVYFQVGHNLELAEPLLRDCLEQLKSLRGEHHLDTLHAMYILSMFYYDNDRLEDAEHLLLKIVEVANESLGYQHRFTLSAVNSLSIIVGKLGKYEEALSIGINCYETRLEMFGVDDHDTLVSLNSLSITYNAMQEYQEAERLLLTCIEKLTTSLASLSPSVVPSASGVMSSSSPTTTSHIHHRAYLFEKQLLHTECLLNIGKSYREMNALERSEEYLLQCVNKAVNKIGDSHRLTLEAKHTYAGLLEKLERFEESEMFYTQCLEGRKLVLGETHSDTLTTMNDMGYLYTSQKKYEEAEHMYLSCLSIASPVTGIVCMSNLGLLYSLLERYEEAEPLLIDCVEKRRALYGDDHYLTKISQDKLNDLIRLIRPPVSDTDGTNVGNNMNGLENRQEQNKSKYLLAVDEESAVCGEFHDDSKEERLDSKNGCNKTDSQSVTVMTPSSPAGNIRRSSFESPRAAKHLVDNSSSNCRSSSFDSPSPPNASPTKY